MAAYARSRAARPRLADLAYPWSRGDVLRVRKSTGRQTQQLDLGTVDPERCLPLPDFGRHAPNDCGTTSANPTCIGCGTRLKAQIIAERRRPGESMAKVAMAHGIDFNFVHGWCKLAREAGAAIAPERVVPVTAAPAVPPMADGLAIEIELRRGGITGYPGSRAPPNGGATARDLLGSH